MKAQKKLTHSLTLFSSTSSFPDSFSKYPTDAPSTESAASSPLQPEPRPQLLLRMAGLLLMLLPLPPPPPPLFLSTTVPLPPPILLPLLPLSQLLQLLLLLFSSDSLRVFHSGALFRGWHQRGYQMEGHADNPRPTTTTFTHTRLRTSKCVPRAKSRRFCDIYPEGKQAARKASTYLDVFPTIVFFLPFAPAG